MAASKFLFEHVGFTNRLILVEAHLPKIMESFFILEELCEGFVLIWASIVAGHTVSRRGGA
jgi:hypothetical protein